MSTFPATPPDFAAVRADFPRSASKLWLAAAETHPYSTHTLRAIEQYTHFRTWGPGADRQSFTAEMQQETKAHFAALIGARPSEIAFVQSTTDGENIILAGLGLSQPGAKRLSNIVIDDLHFEASKYIYTQTTVYLGRAVRVHRWRWFAGLQTVLILSFCAQRAPSFLVKNLTWRSEDSSAIGLPQNDRVTHQNFANAVPVVWFTTSASNQGNLSDEHHRCPPSRARRSGRTRTTL